MQQTILVTACIIVVILLGLIKVGISNWVLKEIYYSMYVEPDFGVIEKWLNSGVVKIFVSPVSTIFIKLQWAIQRSDHKEIERIIKVFPSIHCNSKGNTLFGTMLYSYYLDSNYLDKAALQYDTLLQTPKLRKNLSDGQIKEMETLKRIFIDKDESMIKVLSHEVDSENNNEKKSVNYYRLAQLYYYKKDEPAYKRYMDLAISTTQNKLWEIKILEETRTRSRLLH